MIPNGKEIIIDGHKVVFESTTYQCRGCFFENRDSCPDCDEGIWVEEGSPWHTGTPTEAGLYVIAFRFGNKIEHEIREMFYNPDYGMTFGIKRDIVAWQKIEQYKEESKWK